jgi:hypothetical protein
MLLGLPIPYVRKFDVWMLAPVTKRFEEWIGVPLFKRVDML